MRTMAIIAAAALQVLVLAYMAGEREWVLRTGRVIYLRTAPVYPRDAMRGDYMQLTYDISRVPFSVCRKNMLRTRPVPPDTRVYASLRMDEESLAEVVSLSARPPAEGLFIRGRTERYWEWRGISHIQVRYGIEAWFMPKGKESELEESRWRNDVEVPLEMQVAVSPGGLGVLKGYRWGKLGIGLDLDLPPKSKGPESRRRGRAKGATVSLLNAGDKDLAVVDLPGGRSLGLVPDNQWSWSEKRWRWTHEGEAPPRPEPAHVIVLKPGQAHKIHVDFKDPAWLVVNEKTPKASPKSLLEFTDEESASFLLEYRPPDRTACQALPHADLIWHGRLPTRTFSVYGRD